MLSQRLFVCCAASQRLLALVLALSTAADQPRTLPYAQALFLRYSMHFSTILSPEEKVERPLELAAGAATPRCTATCHAHTATCHAALPHVTPPNQPSPTAADQLTRHLSPPPQVERPLELAATLLRGVQAVLRNAKVRDGLLIPSEHRVSFRWFRFPLSHSRLLCTHLMYG